MTDRTETVTDILDQIAERMATFPNVVEEIRPAGGAGDVGVDVDAIYGLLPPSPSPAVVEEHEQPEESDDDQSTQPEEQEQPDEQEPPVTPPRTIPAFTEPPAVLRKRRTLPEDSGAELGVALQGPSADMTTIQRQVCRAVTPVLGVPCSHPGVEGDVTSRTLCFMSDTEGEETDDDGGIEADDEAEAEAEEEQTEAEEDDIHPEEQLMIKMPFWIFGLTCVAMTLYLTFVIYLLSWECRFPVRGH
jgi:hypothetical protein